MSSHRCAGFSLVELIITLVVIAILAATALPKFIGGSGTDVLVVQDQMISVLRRMQMQAMQQTNHNCHSLQLSSSQLNPTGCTLTEESLNLTLPTDSDLTFSPSIVLSFDSLGRLSPTPSTVTTLVILSSGVSAARVCIETEGYIRPC